MRFKPQAVALIASLVVVSASGGLMVDFILQSSMAYYGVEPARTEQMHRFQDYAVICLSIFVLATVASIIFGAIAFRRRQQAQTKVLHDSQVA